MTVLPGNVVASYEKVIVLPSSDHIKELHTVLRDKNTDRSEFVFCADRLMRLVIEEGLNQLPFSAVQITTPTGCDLYLPQRGGHGACTTYVLPFNSVFLSPFFVVTTVHFFYRIGKILLGEENQVLYSKFMTDIARRRVLLLYPILSTGLTVCKAANVLIQNGVAEENIILLSVFSTPNSIKYIRKNYANMTVITSEMNANVPHSFTTRYFGTD
ncbi:hypothetical protein QR680_009651 [Steinernema hermaphroditum]|uniref:Phosphoribosyltransferase domain-containing protein n=1 Tax=Steinernema hermaphroditum TaxID=289476 RepID=A0AA39M9V0_9BILA|nr:hypothetical protein QR680_009651 [Steinernema hermaphroditum]